MPPVPFCALLCPSCQGVAPSWGGADLGDQNRDQSGPGRGVGGADCSAAIGEDPSPLDGAGFGAGFGRWPRKKSPAKRGVRRKELSGHDQYRPYSFVSLCHCASSLLGCSTQYPSQHMLNTVYTRTASCSFDHHGLLKKLHNFANAIPPIHRIPHPNEGNTAFNSPVSRKYQNHSNMRSPRLYNTPPTRRGLPHISTLTV